MKAVIFFDLTQGSLEDGVDLRVYVSLRTE